MKTVTKKYRFGAVGVPAAGGSHVIVWSKGSMRAMREELGRMGLKPQKGGEPGELHIYENHEGDYLTSGEASDLGEVINGRRF